MERYHIMMIWDKGSCSNNSLRRSLCCAFSVCHQLLNSLVPVLLCMVQYIGLEASNS